MSERLSTQELEGLHRAFSPGSQLDSVLTELLERRAQDKQLRYGSGEEPRAGDVVRSIKFPDTIHVVVGIGEEFGKMTVLYHNVKNQTHQPYDYPDSLRLIQRGPVKLTWKTVSDILRRYISIRYHAEDSSVKDESVDALAQALREWGFEVSK